jgi:ribosomal protein L35
LRHILTSKPKGRKRALRKRTFVSEADARAIKQMFPYG